jgi:hypothetical protein
VNLDPQDLGHGVTLSSGKRRADSRSRAPRRDEIFDSLDHSTGVVAARTETRAQLLFASAPNRESLTVEWASLYEIVTTAHEYRCPAVPRMTVPQAAARRR